MHQLLADSGSTKTDWQLLTDGQPTDRLTTRGLSPLHLSAKEIGRTVGEEVLPWLTKGTTPAAIYFYGSGCADALRIGMVRDALAAHFPTSVLHVSNDLQAAARAACGHTAGVVCILGTGSNSCRYDGHRITDQVPSLGYVLGDEGSGAHLGSLLLRAYFYRQLDTTLARAVERHLPGGKSELLTRVYQAPAASAFLAGFAPILAEHRSHAEARALIRAAFQQFCREILAGYGELDTTPVHFVGSVASVFEPELRAVLREEGFTVGNILQKPMEGLIRYHQERSDWSQRSG